VTDSYAIDPELAEALAASPAAAMDLANVDIPTLRALLEQNRSLLPPLAEDPLVQTEERTIPGPEGNDIPVRIYRPTAPSTEPAPGLVFFHGGAFYMGDLDTEHMNCLRATSTTGCVTVSVDYRLSPEHLFPAGAEDCYAALQWTADHASELGIDTGRIAVGGSSAGGALAAAVALMARDRGGPALCYQTLGYPVLDDRLETPSCAYDDVPIFTGPAAKHMWTLYLGDGRGDVSPYAAPARADDLSGLPPAYIMTAEFDPLRDEGIDYAVRLQRAGVSTELHNFPGTVHGFDLVAPQAAVSQRAIDDRFAALAAAFAKR
jgi:acetyl esterase/lipase